MKISSRAYLANANHGFEVGARIAIAEYLREFYVEGVDINAIVDELIEELDPRGES